VIGKRNSQAKVSHPQEKTTYRPVLVQHNHPFQHSIENMENFGILILLLLLTKGPVSNGRCQTINAFLSTAWTSRDREKLVREQFQLTQPTQSKLLFLYLVDCRENVRTLVGW
jgi:hypothetical protein